METLSAINIDELFLKRENALSVLKENINALKPFINPKVGIKRTEKSDVGGSNDFHSTSTAYAFYNIYAILSSYDSIELPKDLLKEMRSIIASNGENLIIDFMDDHLAGKSTAVATLPNNYNTPIQQAGILSYINYSSSQHKHAKCIEYIRMLLTEDSSNKGGYISKLKKNGGFIERIGTEKEPIPSPYHTFWLIESIILFDQATQCNNLKEIHSIVSNWALDSLAKSLSFTSAGFTQAFDPIEVCYLLLILLTLAKSDSTNIDEGGAFYKTKKLVEHSFDVMFSKYFEKGCFTKSLPVFAGSQNFSLSCPTIEPVSILVMKEPGHFFPHIEKLGLILDWIRGNRVKSENNETWIWRSEWEHSSSPPTSFMSASVLLFLVSFYKCLDEMLCKAAFKALGVVPFSKDPSSNNINYPGDLTNVVKNYIVNPIKEKNKEVAHYSIILFGPPGTSKTTISKKIAQDLNWPLLVINASMFLKGGIERIDAEAERIFTLASYLKDVVVLFDEVEELVLRRDTDKSNGLPADQKSRLLTTSMLPRINDLRSTSRVVFIFATNYLDHIDAAITRTGRFDCVHCVMPPNEEERKKILGSLIDNYTIAESATIKKNLLDTSNISMTNLFCYADLRDLVKRVIIETEVNSKQLNNTKASKKAKTGPILVVEQEIKKIITHEIQVGASATITIEIFEEFKRLKAKYDRPRPTSK